MRTLTLNGQHRTVFKHLYFGFLQGGNNLSKEARIQAKFDAVMQDDPDDRNLPWQLKDGEQVLVLTSEEYQYVDKCLDAVAWPTVGAKGVAEMLDIWGDAQKTE
jgi:hypothetical protein